jgi:ribose 1,5-bisphosphokinase PhnN
MASAAPIHLDRRAISRAAQALIDLLDLIDGDPDFEEIDAEDSFVLSWYAQAEGAGCPIADPGGCEHDGREIEDGY